MSADRTGLVQQLRLEPGSLLRPLLLSVVSVVLLALFVPSWGIAVLILIYAIAAIGCNLLLGFTGLLSVGQSVYFGLGGYVAALGAIHLHLQMLTGLALAALAGVAMAAVIGFLAIRRIGIYFVMITFAFAETVSFLAYAFKDWTGGENGLQGLPLASLGGFGSSFFIAGTDARFFLVAAVIFVVLFVLLQRFVDSPVGSVLVAIRENEQRAEAIGYNVRTYKLIAFMVSGAVTSIAGCLYAFYVGSASISAVSVDTAIMIVIITVLGGIRSLYGSFLGAVAYVLLSTNLSDLWPRWQLLLGAALIAIVLLFKGGLHGASVDFSRWVQRQVRGRGRTEEGQASRADA
ncbi:MAG: branched-chain amino acid ABC transporter permease [Pedococcus sp.]